MKKMLMSIVMITLVCMTCTTVMAAGWNVPNSPGNGSSYTWDNGGYYADAVLIEDLAARSGPSTKYTGCGSFRMKGEYVRVVSRVFDEGGTQWVAVEFSFSGATRRVYTGAKRLNLTSSQLARLPEENMAVFIGYGTVNKTVNPKYGPGSHYVTHTGKTLWSGTRVAVISCENDYYMVECYHTDGSILRSWIPCADVTLD